MKSGLMKLQTLFALLACYPWLIPLPSSADNIDAWQMRGSANLTLNSYSQSSLLDVQYELGLFLDTSHLDNTGFGIGYIRQNQALNNRQDIIDNMLYLGAWRAFYPEALPGKLVATLDVYRGSESLSGSSGGTPGPGGPMMPKPSPPSMLSSFTDSLNVINPRLAFSSFSKTWYGDISYARSRYDSNDASISDLTVKQWAPAVALLFNDQYDRLQWRHYAVELSNDNRTPGVDSTRANELKWTHWFAPNKGTLNHVQLIILQGERLYGVDYEARKIFKLSDMQTASYALGADWSLASGSDVYLYAGLEQYTDLGLDDDYNSAFIYLGIARQW